MDEELVKCQLSLEGTSGGCNPRADHEFFFLLALGEWVSIPCTYAGGAKGEVI
jgi:hypothetical protein